jgi:phosphatidylinositol alpha-1,6-mannosyltransferase
MNDIEKRIKILFISRAYPPVVGGIENQNYELSQWLPKIAEVRTIANTRGKLFLPIFLPYALIKALFLFKQYDAVLLGDGVLAVIGWKLKLFHRKPVICIAHGLDLTYRNTFYHKLWINIFFKKIDRFIAVGRETVRVAREKGIPDEKIVFIPNGVDPNKFEGNFRRAQLKKIIGAEIEGKKFILTSGRLAKRKGVAWFIDNVLPKLPENVIYVVAGDGPDRKNIVNAIEKNNLQSRVKILGYVTDEVRNALLSTCDLFVQPNIKVAGDMEGFGISVIEAACCRIPVLASRLEGLQDAIKDGENGFLLESENTEAWVAKINELLAKNNFRQDFGEKARQYVIENYSWEKISRRYLYEIERIVRK